MLFQGKFIDDIAAICGNMAATAIDIKRDMDQYAASQLEKLADKMQLATKNDADELRAIAEKARAENAELRAKVEELEEKLSEARAAAKQTAKPRISVEA